MSMAIQVLKDDLDEEWVNLLLTARDMDISPDEIRVFLAKAAPSINQD